MVLIATEMIGKTSYSVTTRLAQRTISNHTCHYERVQW